MAVALRQLNPIHNSDEPSLNKHCWVLSLLMPQTNLFLNILFNNKYLYSQYSVNFLNSATNIETLSFACLTCELNLKHSAIIFGCGVYMSLFHMNLEVLLSSAIHLKFCLLQKKINCSIYVFQSSSFRLNSDTFPMVMDILLLFLVTTCYP